MAASLLDVQRDALLAAIRDAGRGEWKLLVVDETSWKLMQNVVKEDDVLNQKIMNIEHIEQRRQSQKDSDAIYFLTPEAHIVDCVMADFERRRYRRSTLLWTSLLPPVLRKRIDDSRIAQEQILALQTVDIGFYPRESNLVTFRDPWSFPILFHRGCDNLVGQHLATIAQKIVSVCVSLGEYPKIRFYRPPNAKHSAKVLCYHLARLVQNDLDMYATYHQDFPPPSTRPRGTLYILDRSLDLFAPLIHEFTYQAMVHDLLPVKDGDMVTYRMKVDDGPPDQREKDVEITEKDRIWVNNRHRHMKDTIDKLMGDFQKFIEENPHFTKADAEASNSLNAIKDMMAGLPQFQELKGAYSLHLTMAQECMNIFQQNKLPDLASVEQSLATGLDEDYKKPKNVADQVVRMLDEDSILPPDRLRLLLLYILYRDGLLPSDTSKLLFHAQLQPQEGDLIRNLEQLGANTTRVLKDSRAVLMPLFPRLQAPPSLQEDYSLSRFEPAVKSLLTEHSRGTLSQDVFPYTKPELETTEVTPNGHTAASLRSAKPTWATSRTTSSKPKQRVILFMAGGATYSESRATYETSSERDKDVYLITSHMLTPALFVRQVRDLSVDPRRLGIPALAPAKKAPAHVFEADPPPRQPVAMSMANSKQSVPLTTQMGNLQVNAQNGHSTPGSSSSQKAPPPASTWQPPDETKKKKKFGKMFSSK